MAARLEQHGRQCGTVRPKTLADHVPGGMPITWMPANPSEKMPPERAAPIISRLSADSEGRSLERSMI
jgi:hypothetical protein